MMWPAGMELVRARFNPLPHYQLRLFRWSNASCTGSPVPIRQPFFQLSFEAFFPPFVLDIGSYVAPILVKFSKDLDIFSRFDFT